jgi:hypothetical protein
MLNFILKRLSLASAVPGGMLESSTQQQDMHCLVLGECVFGESIDRELGDLRSSGLLAPHEKKFRSGRYNTTLTDAEVAGAGRPLGLFTLESLRLMAILRAAGEEYASGNARLEHVV